MSYNYSYNVLINRLEAFAAGHFLIRRFTHGQIDMSDQLQDDQYPFMHVTPDTIEPVPGAMNFGFHIMFADIPRDKEYKAEYQREVISDCIRLGQDLIAEVKNGLELFGFDVQLLETPTFEPFMEEQKNTVTGVAFTIKLAVPWDWSACDIPAIWSVGGASGSGGEGTGYGITLQTNGVDNVVQTLLNLVEGTNITITDNGNGSVTIDSAGGGVSDYVSTAFNVNHTTSTGNPYAVGDRVWYNGNVYQCIANNDAILPTNTSYWTLVGAGFRLRQTPVDWNATSGDFQVLNKPTITAPVNADWNASSGLAQILNKPTIPAAQIQSDWTQANTAALDYIKNKPTIPSAQGLQSVISADNVLTQNNTINANNNYLILNNLTSFYLNAQGKLNIKNEGADDKAEIASETTFTQLLYTDKLNGNVASVIVSGDSSTEETQVDFSVGNGLGTVAIGLGVDPSAFPYTENQVIIKTPAVDAGTATAGQVLQLVNATTGKVEFATAGGGGSGTVTSVATAGLISGGTITTSGTITTAMTTGKLVGRATAGSGIMEEITVGSGLTLTGAGVLNNTATPTPTGYYGAWQDLNTQTAAVSNTGYAMQFGTIDFENQVRMVSDGTNLTRITFDNTGIYNLNFSVQIQNTDNAEHDVTIWLRKNGVDVLGSAGYVTVPKRRSTGVGLEGHTIAGWNYMLNPVGGDYYQIMWSTTEASVVTLQFYAAGSPPPSTASTLCIVTQQSGIMAGTGITAMNGLTGAVQTIGTGTTGTDFAVVSSGTAHTFNLPTASAANRGALSSADWSTFNGKAGLASPAFTGTPTAPTATAGTNNTQIATTAYVDSATNTTLSAYSMRANNTAVSAIASNFTFKDLGEQTLLVTPSWAGTAPTGGTLRYRWFQIGNVVHFHFIFTYTGAGIGNTSLAFDHPSDMPIPVIFSGITASITFLYRYLSYIATTTNVNPPGGWYGGLKRTAITPSTTYGWLFSGASTPATSWSVSGTYYT